MVKLIRNATAVLILLLILGTSCSTSPEEEDLQKSFLWEAKSDGTTVYILGSVHLAKAELYPLDDTIEDAYAQSQILVVEINMNDENLVKTEKFLLEKGVYPAGEKLQNNITDELYSSVSEKAMEFDSSGLLLVSLNMFEPWVVAVVITDMEYMELGYEVEYGIETYFLDKAENDGKDILELETVELQLDIFDGLSPELQIMMLEDAVENPVTEEELELMYDAWSNGDTTQMEQLLFEDIDENPEYRPFYDKIIDERNLQMVEKIEDYLEDDDVYFVIVGAAHLLGENGIVNLLIERGYSVSQR